MRRWRCPRCHMGPVSDADRDRFWKKTSCSFGRSSLAQDGCDKPSAYPDPGRQVRDKHQGYHAQAVPSCVQQKIQLRGGDRSRQECLHSPGLSWGRESLRGSRDLVTKVTNKLAILQK